MRFSERMFAFVRNITGYDVRGPGQEPINAVLYKDKGDECKQEFRYLYYIRILFTVSTFTTAINFASIHPLSLSHFLLHTKNKISDRPHCDGPCRGEDYPYGQRVATTILYCKTPEGGGQTSFTRSGMMISPRPRDLLLFAYKYANGTMDNGFTEHSGCPITGGRKWIATQVNIKHYFHLFVLFFRIYSYFRILVLISPFSQVVPRGC